MESLPRKNKPQRIGECGVVKVRPVQCYHEFNDFQWGRKKRILFLASAKAYCHFMVLGKTHWLTLSWQHPTEASSLFSGPHQQTWATVSDIIGHAFKIFIWSWKTTIVFSANKSRKNMLCSFLTKRGGGSPKIRDPKLSSLRHDASLSTRIT